MKRMLALVLVLLALRAPAAELTTLARKVVKGDLQRITEKEVVLTTDGGEVATPLQEVLQLDLAASTPPPTGSKFSDVELTDGSVLHCSKVELKGRMASLVLLGPEVPEAQAIRAQVPLNAIRAILHDAHDPAVRQEWQTQFASKPRTQDLVVVRKDNVPQPLEGTLGGVDDKGERIDFQFGGKSYKVELKRIHGLLFFQKPGSEPSGVTGKAQDVFRSSLAVRRIEFKDDRFILTTAADVKFEYPRAALARIDYSNDKLAYLSDLEPIKVIEKSTLDRVESYRRDKNLDAGPLRLAGKTYLKGLALHAYAELVYDLDGKFKDFKAMAGVDEAVGGDGRAQLRIEGDGRELYSGAFIRSDDPRSLSLNVKGVKYLRIIVRSDELFDLGTHLNLADAQVSR